MDFTYREYGGWISPGIEVRVHDNQIFVGDRLPMRLEPAEATGLTRLIQHILDAEDEFRPYPSPIADAVFQDLEIHIGSSQVKRFVVRDPLLDAAPAAFGELVRELTGVWRAAMRARLS